MADIIISLWKRKLFGLMLTLLPVGLAHAGVGLEFEWENYGGVAAPGTVLEVKVMIDGDTENPGRQAVANGLFGYGYTVGFDDERLRPAGDDAVMVEPSLNYSGFAEGAQVMFNESLISVKGNIDPAGDFWTGTTLATIRFEVIGTLLSPTPLTLGVFEMNPSDAVFVDGTGTEIDSLIVPGSASIAFLGPLSIEWIADPVARARLTFGVDPDFDVVVEWSAALSPGDWQPLPGAPHNTGEYLDFAVTGRRFYRLAVFHR